MIMTVVDMTVGGDNNDDNDSSGYDSSGYDCWW